jgi:hypothetical protein
LPEATQRADTSDVSILPSLRVSDAQRDEAVEELREHCAEGRLRADELEQRIALALEARTGDELRSALRDLPPLVPDAERTLSHAIQAEALHGWRLTARYGTQAVLTRPRRPNHVLHGVLTLMTGMMWSPIWLLVTLRPGHDRLLLTVDDDGSVRARRVG